MYYEPIEKCKKNPIANTVRADRLARAGALGRTARALDASPTPPLSPDTALRTLRVAEKLHKKGYFITSPAIRPTKNIKLNQNEVRDGVFRMARGAAPGPSGWTRDLILPVLDIPEVSEWLQWLLEGILKNNLFLDLRQALATSRLLLIREEKSPPTEELPACRPIAMGEAFLKLAGITIIRRVQPSLPAIFGDIQHGAGSPNG